MLPSRALSMLKAALVSSALIAIPCVAAEKWDFSSPYPDSYMLKNIRMFADEIRQKTGGNIDMVVHPNAELYKLPETRRAIQSGQLPIGEITLHAFSNEDPLYGLFTMPFLMRDKKDARMLWEASRDAMDKHLAKQGLKLLYSCIWPAQSLFTKKEITSFEGLRGQKFRTQGPTTARLAELMGVSGVEVQTADIPQAFLTGMIDGMYTSDVTTRDLKGWDYLKYSYQVNSWYPINVVVTSVRRWSGLDKATQRAFTEASTTAEKRCWDMETDSTKEAMEQERQHGIKIVAPPEPLMKQFRMIGNQMIDEWKKSTGAEGAAIIADYNRRRGVK